MRNRYAKTFLGGMLTIAEIVAGPALAAGSSYNAWQEMTVLTVSKLENAAASCGFNVNGQQLSVLLDSASLTLDAIHSRPRSPNLQRQIDTNMAAFQSDRETACAKAWETFGADAYPGARDLLQK